MRPSSLARKAVKAAAFPLGVPALRRHGDLVILLYHRVGRGSREIDLPVRTFQAHLDMLSRSQKVRSLDDAFAGREGGIVLTFDDGYRDFPEHVVPLLVRYGVPALLYLATGLVANGPTSSIEALTWSQLADAVGTGLVAVGSHTHSHADLSSATEREAEDEMRRSKELIEDRLGVSCQHFAYPFAVGAPSAERAARRLFDTAALDAWRTNRAGRIDPHRLGRTPVLRSDGRLFFRAKVRGMLDAEALAYRALSRGPWSQP